MIRVPHPDLICYPPLGLNVGNSPISTGLGSPPVGTGWGYPSMGTGWGYPHQDWILEPHPLRRQSSRANTCYVAGNMPFAFTQEVFLVCFALLRQCLQDLTENNEL